MEPTEDTTDATGVVSTDDESDSASGGTAADGDEWDEELPERAVDAAERLTRLAREAVDDAEADAYRADRAERLAEHDFTARVRDEDDTLVCYPEEWIEDGTVQIDRIDDTDRAVEVSLSGPGDPDDWAEIEEHNAALVDAVAEAHSEIHAANARAFADFMGNHYARPMDSATEAELSEFLDEYFPRNAWPSEEQRDAVRASLRYVFEAADERTPL
ncbi:rnhA operon protein [Halobaculum halobium]|uniref:RnhA operon protein n=1 Tax=Halobaculum halobium TaxID=3032281 RepID=A0ABD5TEQ9_9EURY|nr:rnhA operon protein [Halobaculum sp. SYNS20]